MTQALSPSTEQRFVQTGVSWDSFQAIQRGFADSPGVWLFYYQMMYCLMRSAPLIALISASPSTRYPAW